MSKKLKKAKVEETIEEVNDSLSKKELYDLKKKEKDSQNTKVKKKTSKKTSKKKQTHQTSLGARIFAFIMLILMIASTIISITYYFY